MTPAAALPAHSARPAAARIASVTRLAARPLRFAAVVESIGHLVPRSPWSGSVHSVFTRACNIASGELLLTIGTRAVGDGPTTLVLARDGGDLRDRFAVGERVDARDGRIHGPRVELDLANARVWNAVEREALLPSTEIDARARLVRVRLEAHRAAQPNVLDREAAGVAAALADACAALDVARASAQLDRLIGWGEGLTPAGDDFVVGLLAGLDALARGDTERLTFREALARHVVARMHRTTPIAAHALRLAADGAWSARIDRLLAALCGKPGMHDTDAALDELLALGATSGADTASGIVAALRAWSHPVSTAEGP
jgi:hypothetical protein